MSLLPPSTNGRDRGSQASVYFLGLYGLLELVTGLIHFLLPDGGAGVIAGLDLTQNKHTIIGVFAWMGALQIAYGLGILAVACWYRPLVPLFLALALVERVLMSVAAWVTKPSPTGHHPPEHYASLLLVPVLVVFLALAFRSRAKKRAQRDHEPANGLLELGPPSQKNRLAKLNALGLFAD